MKKFSTSQQLFLNSSVPNILVSAGAGSGKTTIMIEKLKEIIKSGTDLSDIMVVTYTKSAAAEMKQRLKTSLTEYFSTTGDPNILDQIDQIPNADIGTFHAFCYKYIIKYFYKLDVDPSVSIVEETEPLFIKAFDNVVEDINVNDINQYYQLFELFNSHRRYSDLYSATGRVYNFLRSLYNADEYVAKFRTVDADFYVNYIYKFYSDKFASFNSTLSKYADEANSLGYDKFAAYIQTLYQMCNSFLNASDVYQAVASLFDNALPRKYNPANTKNMDLKLYVSEVNDELDKFRTEYVDAKQSFICKDKQKLIQEHSKYLNTLNNLLDFVNLVDKEYKTIKKDQNVVDFGDLEDYMLTLVNLDDSCELLNKFKYVFVDEYQDINEKQDYIITKLSQNNEYLIGDVKQSIYAFRLCRPQILLDKYNLWQTEPNKQVIELNENYRSNDKILNFANMIFNILITKDTVGIDYRHKAQLTAGLDSKEQPLTPVKLLLMPKKTENNDSLTSEQSIPLESNLILDEINNIIGKNYYDFDTRSYKQLGFDDIAILVRDRSDMVTYLYYLLKNHNIPCNTEIKNDILSSYETNLLFNYLKLINNKLDDIALTSVLLSHICGLTCDDIAKIRIDNPNEQYLYNVIINSDDIRIKQFLAKLSEFKQKYYVNDIVSVLREMYIYYDLDNYFRSFADGDIKLSNIDIFFSILEKFRKYSLRDIIAYLEASADQKQNVVIGNGGITITTIHDSKGLEYPAVLLVELDKGFVTKSTSNDVVMSMETGIGIKSFDTETKIVADTLSHKAAVISKRKEDWDEKIRLLYVGITRAKNVLRLIGKFTPNSLTHKYVYSANNFLDWIFLCLPNSTLEAIKLGKTSLRYDDFEIEVKSVVATHDREEVEHITYTLDALNKLSVINNFTYQRSVPVSLKTSVSTMMQQDDYTLYTDSPHSLTMSDQTTAITKGHVYHKIMEKLDYNRDFIDEAYVDGIIQDYNLDGTLVDKDEIIKAFSVIKSLIADRKYDREVEFMIRDNYNRFITDSNQTQQILVQGVCDLIVFDKDKIILVDYKTNNYRYEHMFVDKYKLQLDIYAKALLDAYKVSKVEKYVYSFKLKKLIKFE